MATLFLSYEWLELLDGQLTLFLGCVDISA